MKQPVTPFAISTSSAELAWRILSLVNLFRLLVPAVLGSLFVLTNPSAIGQAHPSLFVGVTVAYFLFGVAAISSIRNTWPGLQVQALTQVLADVVAITLITYASGTTSVGLAALLVLPVGACTLVVRQRLGLGLAAVAAIALLTEQTIALYAGRSDQSSLTNAGLLGALIFLVTLGVVPLARRLRESEALIQQRDFDIANLAELNEFIVQHLRESILVVDEEDRVRLINESASQLLSGSTVQGGTLLGEVSPRLLFLLDSWRRHGYGWQDGTLSLVAAGGGAMIQPHFVSLDAESRGPTLIFLEDTSVIAERLQQSKLAALGRLSASIAHEIRNPVGSMSHAAQLLRESPSLSTQDQRLTEIIAANGDRVSQIINNILQLSRREAIRQERIEINLWLSTFISEFCQTLQLPENSVQTNWSPLQLDVRADPSHLQQILWNLCENALKYGGASNSVVAFELNTGRIAVNNRPYLEVADRGSGISSADSERIFEPFFTTGAATGSTGLGLFIARELANANGAVLLYESRPGGGTIFRLVFADPQRWEV
jgi:two-component system sensor histidine kinase PilS (NtrC family)